MRFVQRHAALGQRERLLVAVLAASATFAWLPQTVASTSSAWTSDGEALGLPQRRHRFVVAAELREQDARERVHQREVAAVAGGVQRGRRLR